MARKRRTKNKFGLKTKLEDELLFHMKACGIPAPTREYVFHPTRKWRFDFAYLRKKLAIEVEGGTWTGGRHNSGVGFRNDCIKYNEAAILGWTVLRFTTDMISDGIAIQQIEKFF